jgi:hypothetical protein
MGVSVGVRGGGIGVASAGCRREGALAARGASGVLGTLGDGGTDDRKLA